MNPFSLSLSLLFLFSLLLIRTSALSTSNIDIHSNLNCNLLTPLLPSVYPTPTRIPYSHPYTPLTPYIHTLAIKGLRHTSALTASYAPRRLPPHTHLGAYCLKHKRLMNTPLPPCTLPTHLLSTPICTPSAHIALYAPRRLPPLRLAHPHLHPHHPYTPTFIHTHAFIHPTPNTPH